MNKKSKPALFASIALLSAGQAHAVMFVLSPTGDASADAGFASAASYIESQFSDTGVVINITAGFADLGGSTLGQASSAIGTISYSGFKAASAADSTSLDDAIFIAGLPAGTSYSKFINRVTDNGGSASPFLHTDVSSVRLTKANAKALGLLAGNEGSEEINH